MTDPEVRSEHAEDSERLCAEPVLSYAGAGGPTRLRVTAFVLTRYALVAVPAAAATIWVEVFQLSRKGLEDGDLCPTCAAATAVMGLAGVVVSCWAQPPADPEHTVSRQGIAGYALLLMGVALLLFLVGYVREELALVASLAWGLIFPWFGPRLIWRGTARKR